MANAVEFAYRLTGKGWAEARLAIRGSEAKLTASYYGDPLGELFTALIALTRAARIARASWDDEPGEFRWLFWRHTGQVRVRVVELPWWRGARSAPSRTGKPLLDESCALNDLVAAITTEARRLLEKEGARKYAECWVRNPFPQQQLYELERWLQSGGVVVRRKAGRPLLIGWTPRPDPDDPELASGLQDALLESARAG